VAGVRGKAGAARAFEQGFQAPRSLCGLLIVKVDHEPRRLVESQANCHLYLVTPTVPFASSMLEKFVTAVFPLSAHAQKLCNVTQRIASCS
jgi:hypothetical protein